MKKLSIGAFLLAGLGAIYWSVSDDTAPSPDTSSPKLTQKGEGYNFPTVTRALNSASAPTLIEATSQTQTQEKVQPREFQSDRECVSNMYYGRYLSSSGKNPDDKFSNLRWAVESFSGKDMRETIENASKALGIDKAKLISELRSAAISFFKDTKTNDLRTNQDWFNYWNNQIFAHKYAGLTDTGELSDSHSVAYVSYTKDTLTRNRDDYAVNTAKEIFANIKPLIDTIEKSYAENRNKGLRRGTSLEAALERIGLAEKIALNDQISILIYTMDKLLAKHADAYVMIGLTAENYDLINEIDSSRRLETQIADHLSKQCKLEAVTLKPK